MEAETESVGIREMGVRMIAAENRSFDLKVNPCIPLLNYKYAIESKGNYDLYGKRIRFCYKSIQKGNVFIEYVNEILEIDPKASLSHVEIFLEFEEIGA